MKRILLVLVAVAAASSLFVSCEFFAAFFGGGGIRIAGTIIFAPGTTVPGQGTLVVGLINYVPAPSATTVTWSVPPLNKPIGTSVPYEFTGVQPGRYMVVAWVDVDSDGTYDAVNEPAGAFPQSGDATYDFQSDFPAADIQLSLAGPTGNAAPSAPVLVNPGNGAPAVPLSQTLDWQASTDPEGDPVTYDVYLDLAASPTTVVAADLTVTTYTPVLWESKTYYWKIAAKDNHGNSTDSVVWSFGTASGGAGLQIVNRTPTHLQAGVAQNVVVGVTFNNPINTSTATDATFYVDYSYTTGGLTTVSAHIPGTISWSADRKTLYHTPDGLYLLANWQYRYTVTIGLKDDFGNSLSADDATLFTTEAPVIDGTRYNANMGFASGFQYWYTMMGWSGSNLGSMTLFYDAPNGCVTLKRTNTSDGGMIFVDRNINGNHSVTGGVGTDVSVTVEYWKVSGTPSGDHRLQFAVVYGPTAATSNATWVPWVLVDDDINNTGSWVTRTRTVTLPPGTWYLGHIAVGEGGWDYETRIRNVSIVVNSY